jgi:hypothetical protein
VIVHVVFGADWLRVALALVALAVLGLFMIWLVRAPRDHGAQVTATPSLPDDSEETW